MQPHLSAISAIHPQKTYKPKPWQRVLLFAASLSTCPNTQAQTAHGSLGAIVGGAAGYAIGASPIAAIAGVVGGAVLGNAVTSGHVNGTEVMVKLQDGQLMGVPEVGNPGLHPGERVAILRGADGNTRAVPLH